MIQPTVLVTYVPKSALDRRAAMAPERKSDALMAVMAGMMAVGGTVAALNPAMSQAAAPHGMITRVVLPPVSKSAPKLLANLASELPASDGRDAAGKAKTTAPLSSVSNMALAPSGVRNPPDEARSRQAYQRRDLAGFLDDQGLKLVTSRAAMPMASDASAYAPKVGSRDLPVLAAAEEAMAIVPDNRMPEFAPAPKPPMQEAAQSYPNVFVAGQSIGAVTMRGDRLHLASLIGLLALKFPGRELDRLGKLAGTDTFVSLQALGNAGIQASFDEDGGRLTLDVR